MNLLTPSWLLVAAAAPGGAELEPPKPDQPMAISSVRVTIRDGDAGLFRAATVRCPSRGLP